LLSEGRLEGVPRLARACRGSEEGWDGAVQTDPVQDSAEGVHGAVRSHKIVGLDYDLREGAPRESRANRSDTATSRPSPDETRNHSGRFAPCSCDDGCLLLFRILAPGSTYLVSASASSSRAPLAEKIQPPKITDFEFR